MDIPHTSPSTLQHAPNMGKVMPGTSKQAVYPSARYVFGDNILKSPEIKVNRLHIYETQDGYPQPVSGRWLRDLCSCAQCRNQDTAQRNVNVFKLDSQACQIESIHSDERGFHVVFQDGHLSHFTPDQLMSHLSNASSRNRIGLVPITTWTADIEKTPPAISHAEVTLDQTGLARLLRLIRQYGFAFVDDVPATPEASQALLGCIGPIRNTHYGAFYDFTSDLSSKDTAYTSEALEPHTDTTYFTDPAGLQSLHMLSHTDGTGGESSLVDGFAAAAQLLERDADAYHILSTTGVHAHASGNEGISVQPCEPLPTLTHHRSLGHLMQVRWNNADRAGVALPPSKMEEWYDAAQQFDAIVNDPNYQYWFQLKPGRMLIFDNWRLLHGRAAFTGKRRMCGGYVNRDDFVSRFRMTSLSEEEIRLSTITG